MEELHLQQPKQQHQQVLPHLDHLQVLPLDQVRQVHQNLDLQVDLQVLQRNLLQDYHHHRLPGPGYRFVTVTRRQAGVSVAAD